MLHDFAGDDEVDFGVEVGDGFEGCGVFDIAEEELVVFGIGREEVAVGVVDIDAECSFGAFGDFEVEEAAFFESVMADVDEAEVDDGFTDDFFEQVGFTPPELEWWVVVAEFESHGG